MNGTLQTAETVAELRELLKDLDGDLGVCGPMFTDLYIQHASSPEILIFTGR